MSTAVSSATALAQYDHLVPRIAWRFVGRGADLDDLIQEGRIGLLTAVENWKSNGPTSSFGAFATVCVRNAVRNAAQSARSRARWGVARSMDYDVGDGTSLHDLHGAPSTQEGACAVARLRHAIEQLPAREREILRAVADGSTYEEIARSRKDMGACRVRQIAVDAVETIARQMARRVKSRSPVKAPKTPTRLESRQARAKLKVNTKPRELLLLEYKGRRLTKARWARETGIAEMTLYRRLDAGWTLAAALETPVVRGRPRKA